MLAPLMVNLLFFFDQDTEKETMMNAPRMFITFDSKSMMKYILSSYSLPVSS